jgi:uncharacterized protein YcbX
VKLAEINIYPVKSTRGIPLEQGEVVARGLRWDRRWMLVDEAGNFITARQYPALSRVATAIGEHTLEINGPGQPPLSVPLRPQSGDRTRVTVWKSQCAALLVGAEADAWFSDYLGLSCRLVQMTDELVRDVDPAYGRPGDEVSFADGFPLLLIGRASLDDLSRRLGRSLSMRRFRPNLVVEGSEAYAEDDWRRIRIGGLEFDGVKNCSRCIFTTIDPDTGVPDPDREPLRTLAAYRRRAGGGVFFGQNLIPRGEGMLRLGDTVEILE